MNDNPYNSPETETENPPEEEGSHLAFVINIILIVGGIFLVLLLPFLIGTFFPI